MVASRRRAKRARRHRLDRRRQYRLRFGSARSREFRQGLHRQPTPCTRVARKSSYRIGQCLRRPKRFRLSAGRAVSLADRLRIACRRLVVHDQMCREIIPHLRARRWQKSLNEKGLQPPV